jgi:hypothetical protein
LAGATLKADLGKSMTAPYKAALPSANIILPEPNRSDVVALAERIQKESSSLWADFHPTMMVRRSARFTAIALSCMLGMSILRRAQYAFYWSVTKK